MLYISDALNVDHRAYPTGEHIRQTTPIRAVKLDHYFRPGERVDLIKLDIQGYELHALRGAERLLQERAELKLLLECWPYGLALAGGSTTQLHGFLRQRGTKIGRPFLNRRLEDDNFPDRSRQFPDRKRDLRFVSQ